MEWGEAKNFIWFWMLAAAIALFYFAAVRKKSQISRFGEPALVERLLASFNPAKRLLKQIFILLAVFFIVLALCQPHFRTREITVERKGVDVILAVDVSRSMLAKDIAPNRLEKAKLELSTLIDRLRQDRIGIVAFAGQAFIQCPLTLDKSAVKLFLSTLSPDIVPIPGTAIGGAINVSAQAFSEKEKEFKAVVLLTDGEDHESSPVSAAIRAKQSGVKIFTIGIGTSEGSILPDTDEGGVFKKDRQGRAVLSKLDEPLLRKISEQTGGTYYRSSRGEIEVDRIVSEINKMTQKGLKRDKIIEYEENYQLFVALAFILLITEMFLSERRREILTFIFILSFLPFLCGFSFYSTVKNEQGNKFYKKGAVGKAKSAYEAAQKSDPQSPVVAFNLGNAYYKEEAYDKSLESYEKAARDEKSPALQAGAFYNLGNNLARTRQNDKAVELYKQALRLNPKDGDAKYNLQLLMKQKEDQKKDKKQDQQKDQKQDKQDQKKDQQNQQNQNQQNQKHQKGEKDQQQSGQQGQQKQQNPQNKEGQGQKENQQDQKKEEGGSGKEEGKQKEQKQQNQQDEGKQEESRKQKAESEDEKQQEAGSRKDEGKEEEQKRADGSGKEDQEKVEEKERRAGGAGQEGEEKKQEAQQEVQVEPVKTQGQIRAEQILEALENQEKKTIKLKGGDKGPVRRAQYLVDKDW